MHFSLAHRFYSIYSARRNLEDVEDDAHDLLVAVELQHVDDVLHELVLPVLEVVSRVRFERYYPQTGQDVVADLLVLPLLNQQRIQSKVVSHTQLITSARRWKR